MRKWMKHRSLILLLLCIVIGLGHILSVRFLSSKSVHAFSAANLRLNVKGNDVKELQGRLHYIGYYNRPIDGYYGYGTLLAVKNFQQKFSIKADGVVGMQTKIKLARATAKWKAPRGFYNKSVVQPVNVTVPKTNRLGFSANDIKLMANAVHGESRGEPYMGQVAVAAVIINRIKNGNFPKTPAGVIFQPGAFTAVADGQIYLVPNQVSRRAVLDAINGLDPTGGCIYYFNPATATNKWIWSRPQIKRIGKHIFCM
jgi:N-acetylmuramoyl-L-alanine amidase